MRSNGGEMTLDAAAATPIQIPMTGIRTIGAGGGSVARVDAGGMLVVGPTARAHTPAQPTTGVAARRPP